MLPSVHRILIVDNDRILRQGLRFLLGDRPSFQVVGDADSTMALTTAVDCEPTIILMDLWLPHSDDGLRILGELHQSFRDARIIVTASRGAETDLVHRAIRAGASGYLLKSTSDIDEVDLAIRTVARDRVFFSPSALTSLVDTIKGSSQTPLAVSSDEPNDLSPREQGVLDLVAEGYTNRQIADRLVISESTVRSHLHNILEKLQLANRVQAAAFALRTRPTAIANQGTASEAH